MVRNQIMQKYVFDPKRIKELSYAQWKARVEVVVNTTGSDDYFMKHWIETNVAGEASKMADRWFKAGLSWQDVLKKLDKTFAEPDEKRGDLLEEYSMLRQQKGESVRVFADKLEILYQRSHEAISTEEREI